MLTSVTNIVSKSLTTAWNLLPNSRQSESENSLYSISDRLKEINADAELTETDKSQQINQAESIVKFLVNRSKDSLNNGGNELLTVAIDMAAINIASLLINAGVPCNLELSQKLLKLVEDSKNTKDNKSQINHNEHQKAVKILIQQSIEIKNNQTSQLETEPDFRHSPTPEPEYPFLSFFSKIYRSLADWVNTRLGFKG